MPTYRKADKTKKQPPKPEDKKKKKKKKKKVKPKKLNKTSIRNDKPEKKSGMKDIMSSSKVKSKQ